MFRGTVPDVPEDYESDPENPNSVPAWEYEDEKTIYQYYVNPVKFIPEEVWDFADEYFYRKRNNQMPDYNKAPARFIDTCIAFDRMYRFWDKPNRAGYS